jgi:hypothetical protein
VNKVSIQNKINWKGISIKVCILQLDKKYIEIVFHISYFLQSLLHDVAL